MGRLGRLQKGLPAVRQQRPPVVFPMMGLKMHLICTGNGKNMSQTQQVYRWA